MGKRGPAPKPTKLKILAGNPGRRPINTHEPQPTRGIPSQPSWLSAEARAEWKRITPELDRLGVLTLVDRSALTAYCMAHAELYEASRLLNREGRIITVEVFARDSGIKVGTRKTVHPAVKLQREAFRLVKQFLGEFGLTPASRSNLKAPPADDANEDPLQTLINSSKRA
jgi:P27 family predicted phage terminase small subunit